MIDMLTHPMFFIGVMVSVLALVLHICIRNEGWFPTFRQLRIRRALIVSLLLWGLSVLIAPLRATPRIPALPVAACVGAPHAAPLFLAARRTSNGAEPVNKSTDITTLFNDLDAGIFVERLSAALRDTALGVTTTGKKGKVTITLDLERIGDSSQVKCNHAIKYAKPTIKGKVVEEASTSTPLHVGVGGVLSLFPETQADMFTKRAIAAADAASEG